MALETVKNIDVDFYNNKYMLINAKQYDDISRRILVTCYDQGKIFNLSSNKHAAYVRYRKADGHVVYSFCTITTRGQIEIELTEQMLAASGVCDVDLVIVNKGNAMVNVDTGEIMAIDNSEIISTMVFRINVYESAVDNSYIESSDEFSLFNSTLKGYWANFENVVKTAKSYSEGGTGTRENEDNDNAKYYYQQSLNNASISSQSEANASASAQAASASEAAASASEQAAKASENAAKESEQAASDSEKNAKDSEDAAKDSEAAASASAQAAKESEQAASSSEKNASASEAAASASETNALNSANRAQSYTVGGTGTRENEDSDNAKYYYEAVKNILIGVDSGFIPMGTLTFAELLTAEKLTGYVYNINEDFVTDNSFREGEGKSYTAGTNVYVCYDGMLDCLGGASSTTATVNEVKNYLGI